MHFFGDYEPGRWACQVSQPIAEVLELGSYIPATVQWANPGLRPWSPYPVGCCSASVTWGLILPLLGYASRQEGSVAEVLSLE